MPSEIDFGPNLRIIGVARKRHYRFKLNTVLLDLILNVGASRSAEMDWPSLYGLSHRAYLEVFKNVVKQLRIEVRHSPDPSRQYRRLRRKIHIFCNWTARELRHTAEFDDAEPEIIITHY